MCALRRAGRVLATVEDGRAIVEVLSPASVSSSPLRLRTNSCNWSASSNLCRWWLKRRFRNVIGIGGSGYASSAGDLIKAAYVLQFSVRYLGVDVEDALEIAEATEV